jgi:DNA-binding transcriptional MocR family regulator
MEHVDMEIALELNARHRLLNQYFPQHSNNVVPGFNSWIPLPEPLTGYRFSQRLQDKGVHVREAEMFTVGRYPPPAAIRISLTGPTSRNQLKTGLEIIRREIDLRTED